MRNCSSIDVFRGFTAGLVFGVIIALCLSIQQKPSPTSSDRGASYSYEQLPFLYYDRSYRMNLLNEIRGAFEARYASLELKKRRLGVDPLRLIEEQKREEETMVEGPNPVDFARQNLEFLDRLQALMAKMQDSHLRLQAMPETARVELGVRFELLGDEVVVTGLRDQCRPMPAGLSEPRIGDKLIAIDHRPVSDWLDKLGAYLPAGSDEYRRSLAAQALSRRNILWPKKKQAQLWFERRENGSVFSLSMPWCVEGPIERADAKFVAEALDLKQVDEFDPEDEPLAWQLRGLKDEKSFYSFDRPSEQAYKMAWLESSHRRIAYLQINSFMSMEVVDNQGASYGWEEPIQDFLMRLKSLRSPLVIDLRFNEGGHTFLAESLLSMLMAKDDLFVSYTEGLRVLPSMLHFWQAEAAQLQNDSGAGVYSSERQAAKYLREARLNHRQHTHFWPHVDSIKADPIVGGFQEPVIALISPHCMSSCDIAAMLLKENHRALLVGGATNGSGSGFLEWPPFSGGIWRDRNETIQLHLPNFLVGRPIPPSGSLITLGRSLLDSAIENQPIQPDVEYLFRWSDHFSSSRPLSHPGWLDLIVKSLPSETNLTH